MIKGVFWFLFIVGVAMFLFGLTFVTLGNEAGSWPATTGKILKVGMGSKRSMDRSRNTSSDGGRTYYPVITYQWEVGGQTYQSNRYALGTTHREFNHREDAEEAAAKWSAQSEIEVYYDPDAPEMAVLDPSLNIGLFVPIILGLLFGLIGFFGLKYAPLIEQATKQGPGKSL